MTFEDWFNEKDGIVNWLKAAYQAGYEQGKYDSL